MKTNVVIGVDVSKSVLDWIAGDCSQGWSDLCSKSVGQISNEVESIELFLSEINPAETLFVFEPTGSYSDKLMCALVQQGYSFALVNPRKAHYFCQSMGISIKTDQTAARLLAYMGLKLELPLYQRPSEAMIRRKRLLTALNGLQKQQQMLRNQLHAQKQYFLPDDQLMESLNQVLETVEDHIGKLEAQLQGLEDEQFKQAKQLAMSIMGIGPVTAHWLLIVTDCLQNFHNPRQLLKYCGLSPSSHRSGTSVDIQGGITKQACNKLRATLFMAARSAIRCNHACKDLYQRLRNRGKPYYKAMVAVMAKLLKQAFGVIKSGKPFDNDYYLRFRRNLKILA